MRAVGESPAAADAMGINVAAYRYAHTIAGGALAGIAGATFTLAINPLVGRRDHRRRGLDRDRARHLRLLAAGALPRSARTSSAPCRRSRPELQARQINLGPTVLWTNALPYLATIVVLVIVSAGNTKRRLGAPAALGRPYTREER